MLRSSRSILSALRLSVFAVSVVSKVSQSDRDEARKAASAKASKHQAGVLAVDEFVKDDMVVGLGTGNTMYFAVERLGELLALGQLRGVSCVAVNTATARHCAELQIPVVAFSNVNAEHPIDLVIDSADEVDASMNILKGSKGSLSRERFVNESSFEYASLNLIDSPPTTTTTTPLLFRMMWHSALQRVVVISDEAKLVKRLGLSAPLSVEVSPWGVDYVKSCIASLPSIRGARTVLRTGTASNHSADGLRPALTESGTFVLDVFFDTAISDPHQLDLELSSLPGVISHGLLVGQATSIVLCTEHDPKVIVGNLPSGKAEPAFWGEKQPLRPLETETVDNRRI